MAWVGTSQEWLTESESLQNAQLVVNHLKSNWSKESISALLGNMRHESSINPQMSEYGYSWDADRGYGLVQWTPRSKYWNWATGQGLDPYSGDSQLARIDYEVDNNIQWFNNPNAPEFDGISFSEFRSGAGLDVNTLTKCFMAKYEHPNWSAGTSSLSDRQAFAVRCFNELDWTGTSTGGGGNDICFIFPTETHNVTSGFETPDRPDHYGVDFADGVAHDIVATADGTVSKSYVSDSYGEVVFIKHNINGQQYETVSAHMVTGSRTVAEGDRVTQGQKIGVMGTTGDSTGLHLHFEMHKPEWTQDKANAIDPMTLLGKGGCGGGSPGQTTNNNQIYHLWLSGALRW